MHNWIAIHLLSAAFGLLVYVLTSHAMHNRRDAAAAISWVLIIALLPYLGLPLYLAFGIRKLKHAKVRYIKPALASSGGAATAWWLTLAASMDQPPPAFYRKLAVHGDGTEARHSLWQVIDRAKHDLVLCTFILGRDPLGEALIRRLKEKAGEGVNVRVLLDGFGLLLGGRVDLRELQNAGIQVTLFGPILRFPFKNRANLRNHRKFVVADGVHLWTGGRNFAVEYFEGTLGRDPWQDLSFDLEGPLAAQVHDLFESDWAYSTGSVVQKRVQTAACTTAPVAQLIASGPDQADDTVHNILITACFKARHRIIAVTPYFVPSNALLNALALAARRGVTVDLILPKRSNHMMADFARHRALRALTAATGRVWQTDYMLHAKAVVFDDDLALAGSANLDSRSLFLNYELMVAFSAAPDVQRIAAVVATHQAQAKRYRADPPGLWRDFAEGLALWLAFQL